MNDDTLSELILRASAYLDGELDADEVALAEADPAVMAEVELMRALRDEVRDVAPAAAEARESAIAAALAEFDRAGSAAAAPAPAEHAARVVPFKPRPAYTRWLTAAAAVVAVGVLGTVAVRGAGGGDDEEMAVTSAAAEDLAEGGDAARTDLAPEAAPEAAPEMEAQVFGDEMATGTMAAEATEAPSSELAVAEETAAETGDAGGVSGTPPAPPTTGTTGATTPVVTLDAPVQSDDLFAVGRELLARFEAGTLGTTPETKCDLGGFVVLARVVYVTEGVERDAIIGADPAFPEVGAFDAETCEAFDIVNE